MNLRIGHKLFLAMLVTTGLGIAFMMLAQRYSFERGLLNYAQKIEFGRLELLKNELTTRYEQTGSWEFIAGSQHWPSELIRFARGGRINARDDRVAQTSRQDQPDERTPEDHTRYEQLPRSIAPMWRRVSLLDKENHWIAGAKDSEGGIRQTIYANGVVVGHLELTPLNAISDELDLQFSQQQLQAVLWAAIVVLIGATVAAAILVRSLVSPIQTLAKGTRALADGHYDTRLDLSRKDEIGLLATDFNSLAVALEQNQQARQQWVADISHELRTPVTVLQAKLESLEDGIRPFDRTALVSLSSAAKRLRLLVNDLHQLTQSESGVLAFKRAPVDIIEIVRETIERFRERSATSNLTLEFDESATPLVNGDADRLQQLFDNLMENAHRYTDAGGTIRLRTKVMNDQVRITIEDSAPGVPDEALPRLFDRLYRVDPSRTRDSGASGLGLAICASIVKVHGGQIQASHSTLGGLAICVDLPIDVRAG